MPSLPKTFRAVRIESKDAPLKIVDVELKQPKAGEVLIKSLACGVCHSDEAVRHALFGNSLYVLNSLLGILMMIDTILALSFPVMKSLAMLSLLEREKRSGRLATELAEPGTADTMEPANSASVGSSRCVTTRLSMG